MGNEFANKVSLSARPVPEPISMRAERWLDRG